MARFEREVDPDGTLPPEERARRAEHKRKAYFARLALKSAKARRARLVVAKGEAAEAELATLGGDAPPGATSTSASGGSKSTEAKRQIGSLALGGDAA